jgi:hypothetical protein
LSIGNAAVTADPTEPLAFADASVEGIVEGLLTLMQAILA